MSNRSAQDLLFRVTRLNQNDPMAVDYMLFVIAAIKELGKDLEPEIVNVIIL